MKTFDFSKFKSLKQLLQAFKTEADCIHFLEEKEWKIGVEEKFLTFARVLVFLSVDLEVKRCRAGGFDRRK